MGDQDALDPRANVVCPGNASECPLETLAARSLMVCALLLVDMAADSMQSRLAGCLVDSCYEELKSGGRLQPRPPQYAESR
jgi:hypothetical protein